MATHQISKGLNLPIAGDPVQKIHEGRPVTRVATIAADFAGMKPRMAVKVGEQVKRGQLLFEDRKAEGVRHTAHAAGRIVAINRGDFRALQSIVIELSEGELSGKLSEDELQSFENFSGKSVNDLNRDQIVALLTESGAWTAFRKRPFDRVPQPSDAPPHSIVVNGWDSNPHAPEADKVVADRQDDLERGLAAIAKLSGGKTYLCKQAGSRISAGSVKGITVEEFKGPHPAGTAGFQIHTLDPVDRNKAVWYCGLQEAIAIGSLLKSGRLDPDRVVSIAGPTVLKPRLLRTRVGASLSELTQDELEPVDNRVISGSVLAGRTAVGDIHGYLGLYSQQITALREGKDRELFGWLTLGAEAYSTAPIYLSYMNKAKKFAFTTNTNGSRRAMVPIGMYERVFPFDMYPTHLLRALLMRDLTRAEELGALELGEEDLALCTFVCPQKWDYAPVLRDNLEQIWKEG